MTGHRSNLLLVAAPALALLWAGSASAQATRTWVSGVGDDVNPCSRTAPCKTFPGAIVKTAAGGEIDVLDPGGFGAVTITKSITINGDNGPGVAGILVAGTNGITINAGPTDTVVIRGLVIDGGPLNSNSLSGVKIFQAGKVSIYNTSIKNFTGGSPNGYGVSVTPSSATKVVIDNCRISDNGTASGGAGVYIGPTGAATASVSISRTQIFANTVGVKADGSTGTGAINVQLNRSFVTHSLGQGLLAQSNPGAPISMFVDDSVVADNGSPGLRVQGANATATVGGSTFTGNGGPGMQAQAGGVLNSYRNNQSFLNGAPDSATVQVTPN